MGRLAAFGVALVMALAPASGQAAAEAVEGFWLSENKRAIIKISSCGEALCGRMVWLSNPVDEAGAPKRDVKGMPLCGIALVDGFREAAGDRWDDGQIYNPRDGRQYSARLTLLEEDRLEVRGYVGLPLFGQSQVWTREASDRGGC